MKITKAFFTAVFTFIAAGSFVAQNSNQKEKIDNLVLEIKQNNRVYKRVDKADHIRKQYCFYKDNELKLVTLREAEEGVETTISLYYESNKLIFCEQSALDLETKKTVNHDQFYMNEGHLIAWVDFNDKSISESSSKFKKMEPSVLDLDSKLKDCK